MKLTKDDFYGIHSSNASVGIQIDGDETTTTEELIEYVLKNQEKAEKWDGWTEFRKTHYEPLYAKKMNEALGDVEGNYDVVERLRELLKGKTDAFSFTGKQLRTEILGEDK